MSIYDCILLKDVGKVIIHIIFDRDVPINWKISEKSINRPIFK